MRHDFKHRFRPSLEGVESRTLLSAVMPLHATIGKAPTVAVARGDEGPLDRLRQTRFSNERQKLTRRDFPNLGSNYEVLAPSSGRYNCIAYSLGLHDRWIAPQTGPARAPLLWADRLYAKEGYSRLPSLDASLQPGEIKVVLYGYTNPNGSIRELRHAALQSPDGTWTSKLGTWALIRHPSPGSVSGPLYGRPIAIYARTA